MLMIRAAHIIAVSTPPSAHEGNVDGTPLSGGSGQVLLAESVNFFLLQDRQGYDLNLETEKMKMSIIQSQK